MQIMIKHTLVFLLGCFLCYNSHAQLRFDQPNVGFNFNDHKSNNSSKTTYSNYNRQNTKKSESEENESSYYEDWESEDVDEFYEKITVKSGSLGDDGKKIDFILAPTTIKPDEYKVEITDFKNDVYEIKGTDYFVKFRTYYGYAGYGDEGILVIGSSSWNSKFFKKP